MRKIIAFIVNVTMAAALLAASASAAGIDGDVNRDGRVDGRDVALLREYVESRGRVEIDRAAADVNGDGEINVFDLAALRLRVERRAVISADAKVNGGIDFGKARREIDKGVVRAMTQNTVEEPVEPAVAAEEEGEPWHYCLPCWPVWPGWGRLWRANWLV